MKDYEKKYEEFWKDIVENEDGTLNKDQIMRELSDYSMIMDNCTKAYMAMTNGTISKPNRLFREVESMFNGIFIPIKIVKEEIKEMVENSYDFEDLKFKLLDYLR